MNILGWILLFAVGRCHHRRLSRVFTIQKRTYQVCLECAQEFEYSWELMRPAPSMASADVNGALNPDGYSEVPVPAPAHCKAKLAMTMGISPFWVPTFCRKLTFLKNP
jgi:hypothetical protein